VEVTFNGHEQANTGSQAQCEEGAAGCEARADDCNLPKATRRDLGKQGAGGRSRGGAAGRALEDRNRHQLYELAKKRNIHGRSKMGKWDLIRALRG